MWRHSYVVSDYIATLPYVTPVLPCEIFLRVPVKITVQVLAAGCQLSYRKFYGFFLQCTRLFTGFWMGIKRLAVKVSFLVI